MMQNGLQQSFHSGPDQFYCSGFGWSSGMALRQIMSHMDLSNYQNPGLDKSQSIENDYFSQTCSTPNSQTKSSCQSAESMDFEGSNSNSAWLGPQLWGATQVRVDVSIPEMSLVHDTSKKEELKESPWSNKDRRLSNESMTSFDQTELSEFTSADLCLASLPGCSFDPRTRSFSLEELKPQPIIRKRQKLYVEESQKSETYWNKRVINNVAARKSRDSRRLKENQIALRAAFLESENVNLKTQVEALTKTNDEMKMDVEKLMQSLRTLQKLKQLK